MPHIAFKYRLYPTKAQATELHQQLETLRRVYNAALVERKDAWELWGQNTTLGQQVKRFQVLRHLSEESDGPKWLARVAAVPVRDTLKQLDIAYKNFFRRLKNGEKPGAVRFKAKGRFTSIPFDNYNSGLALVDAKGKAVLGDMADDSPTNCKLKVFGVGKIKIRLHRPVKGKIKTARVIYDANRWFVVLTCEVPEIEVSESVNPPVGVDVGLEHFLTTSDGEHVPNPKYLNRELKTLRRAQRVVSRRKKRSNRRKKAIRRVSELHYKVRNQRREHAYRVSNDLTGKYGVVCVESLNVQGMMRNDKLARHIADAGWSGFVNVLKHTAKKAGVRVVEVDPKGTSQTCPRCDGQVKKDLSVRVHDCPHCGYRAHRDHASAQVILRRGLGGGGRPPAEPNVAGYGERVPRNEPYRTGDIPRVVVKNKSPHRRPKGDRSKKAQQLTLWQDDA